MPFATSFSYLTASWAHFVAGNGFIESFFTAIIWCFFTVFMICFKVLILISGSCSEFHCQQAHFAVNNSTGITAIAARLFVLCMNVNIPNANE